MWIQMQKRPLTKIKAKKGCGKCHRPFFINPHLEFENKILDKERKL